MTTSKPKYRRLIRAASLTLLAVLLVEIAVPRSGFAATHDVTVSTSFFTPNNLTIQAGDTVRWTYTPPPAPPCGPYGGGCGGDNEGVAHSIAADDGSFTSGNPQVGFTFEHTFNQPGEHRYYCVQHSQPGRDITTNMNGRIVVQGSAAVFQINAGLNDAWFNPDTPGQGFFITVFPDIEQMFVAWFTYDIERPAPTTVAELGEPGHRWITAFGPYADNQAVLDVEVTSGGVFNANPPATTQVEDGTLTLEFDGCNAATVSYDFPSLDMEGSTQIERIAVDNIPGCEALAGTAR